MCKKKVPAEKTVLMLLSNEYRPDPRVEKEALTLSGEGYRVKVICWDRNCSRVMNESPNRIEVERIRTLSVEDVRSFIFNFPFFMVKMILRALRTNCDIVHSHDLDTLFQGVIVSKLKGIPLVYDAHEHYASMVFEDVPRFLSNFLNSFEKSLVDKADVIIAANEKIAEILRDSSRVEPVIVMNCIDLRDFPNDIGQRSREREKIVVFYGGSLEPLRYLIEVATLAISSQAFILRIAGSGRLADHLEKISQGFSNVEFLGYLPRKQLLDELKNADIALCLLDPKNKNNKIGTPNRLFEAMALGVPVIASEGTLTGEIVKKYSCGLVIEWSEQNFLRAINTLRDPAVRKKLGANGRIAAEKEYNWESMKFRLIHAYSSVKKSMFDDY
ncbi:MAG: glycosyltransferase family 4 protein [Methanomassiliicoccales archaeon]|nr:glycosyltransferase family 4 protein [Methanomassiliicoccales archaeon]